jgi:lysophospholipase L1-like esterase
MPNDSTPLSLKQKILLSVGVPCVLLLILEGSARLLLLTGVGAAPAAQPVALEMPTWMMKDANAIARAKPSKDALDWLSMFVEGDGYRVRLIPNAHKSVKNTFSLISADRERRYEIAANALGFRGPLVTPEKGPNTFRIVVFGDSSSFGWGVNAEDSWWMLLQQELQKHYPEKTIEVANFAIPGDSSAYGKLIFDTFAPQYQSDVVILGFGANDAKDVFTSHTEQVSRFTQKRSLLKVVAVLQKSALVTLLKGLLPGSKPSGASSLAAGKSTPSRVRAVSVRDYGRNMITMAQSAEVLGSKEVIFLGLCTPPSYARKARLGAQKNGFLWLNGQSQLVKLLPHIQKGELYPDYVERMERAYSDDLKRNELFYVTSDGCHPNELGHRYVADQLVELLTTAKLIQN